jgi:hypothetical protein
MRQRHLAALKSDLRVLKNGLSSSFQREVVSQPHTRFGENMKNLKRLGSAVVLLFVLTLPGFAGETLTPPCAPGEVSTPPCSSALVHDSALPGQTETPPASESIDILALAEIGLRSLLLF